MMEPSERKEEQLLFYFVDFENSWLGFSYAPTAHMSRQPQECFCKHENYKKYLTNENVTEKLISYSGTHTITPFHERNDVPFDVS